MHDLTTVLTLQDLSGKVKLHDRKSAKDVQQVEGKEKGVDGVSTWLSSMSVIYGDTHCVPCMISQLS